MFSPKLERRRQFDRLAILVALALFAGGAALIAFWAMRASTLLAAAEARGSAEPIAFAVAIAFGGLIALCILVYLAVRLAGRAPP
jgi:hypothetical protein